MTWSSLRTFALSVSALVLALLLPAVASLKGMATRPLMAADLRTILGQAGLTSLGDNVMAALAGPNTSVVGGVCTDATPEVGSIVECDVRPGEPCAGWRFGRRAAGRSKCCPTSAAPARSRSMPICSDLFRVVEDRRTYTFVVPKDCGNLSLMATEDAPAAVVAMAAPAPAPLPPPPPPARAPIARVSETAPPPLQVPPPAPVAIVAPRGTPIFIDAPAILATARAQKRC